MGPDHPLTGQLMRFLKNWLALIVHRAYEHAERKLRNEWEQMEKEKFASCGPGVHLNGRSKFSGHYHINIGANVHIGNNAHIRGEGGLYIGDNTHISRNLVLYTVNHNFEGESLPSDAELIMKEVYIGKNVAIGMNVCITPGTTIDDGAVIGMGAIVSGHVPKLAYAVGYKQKVIKYRDV
jgi:maltose O-acetyltransferase